MPKAIKYENIYSFIITYYNIIMKVLMKINENYRKPIDFNESE